MNYIFYALKCWYVIKLQSEWRACSFLGAAESEKLVIPESRRSTTQDSPDPS